MSKMKKVLIITYYWPPAGGPGVQRVLKFAKYLPQFGWQPIILTVQYPNSPTEDKSLLSQIPKTCKVYKSKTFEPFDLYRKFTGKKSDENIPKNILEKRSNENIKERFSKWIRSNLFVPDARIGWIHNIKKVGIKIIEKENPDIIFSSSPPHSLQIGAKKLAKKSGLKWVADFRDPWNEAYWLQELNQNRFVKKMNQYFEKSVLKNANSISTISSGIVSLMRNKVDNEYHIIHNGADEIVSSTMKSNKFIILFLGSLSKHHNITSLLNAISSLSENVRNNLELRFVGKIFDGHLKTIKNYKNFKIIIRDYLPYQKAMSLAKESSILYKPNAMSSYSNSTIGAKTYDYLSLRKPILVIGKGGSAIKIILDDTKSGRFFENNDMRGIEGFLLNYYNIWLNQKYIILNNKEKLEKYTTIYNVEKLSNIFNKVVGK